MKKIKKKNLDPSFFDALMGIDCDFLNTNDQQQTNFETINTQKILNQLIKTSSLSNNNCDNNDTFEITNEQIDLLLKSSNLLNDSNYSSRSSSADEEISAKKPKRNCKKPKFFDEIEDSTQDTTHSNNNNNCNNNEDDDYSNFSSQSMVKRKVAGSGRNSTKNVTRGRTPRRNNSVDSNDAYKKESNKEAATRYRIKKLSEKDQLFETKVHLERQNDDTKKKIDHVQTEINYLKNLLCQVLLTKGILS